MALTPGQQAPLLVELLVEELPPKALPQLGQSFAQTVLTQLQAQGLVEASAMAKTYASPRRLAVYIAGVLGQAPARQLQHKIMPVSVGLDITDCP